MAKSNATANVKKINFQFSISEISKLNDKVWSPEYLIDGMPWKVYAYKCVSDAQPSLALYLQCTKSNSSSNWSHVASATFELLSSESGCAARKRETGPMVFNHLSESFGLRNFIKWDELFDAKNDYVKDDAIDLQIEIRAESSNAQITSFESISKSCDDGCLSIFRMTISNIESLSAVKTPRIVLRKIPCEMVLFKRSNNLYIRLFCKPSQFRKIDFSIELTADLVSSNYNTKRCEKGHGAINRHKCGLHMPQFISWDELIEPKNGFVKDGGITIEFEIKTELGGLILNANKRKATNDQQPARKQLKVSCKICKKDIIDQDVSSLPCGHVFCSTCITESIKVQKKCPSCDVRVTQKGVRRILLLP